MSEQQKELMSPLIENFQLKVDPDATRGDAKPIAITQEFKNKINWILQQLKGLDPNLINQQKDDYWMPEEIMVNARSRRLGEILGDKAFAQRGAGDVLLHEKIHYIVSNQLAAEIETLGPEINEALAFALQAAMFGVDANEYLKSHLSSPYDNREAQLTAHFLRMYYILGMADLIELIKTYAKTIKEAPQDKKPTIDELILLFDKQPATSVESVKNRVKDICQKSDARKTQPSEKDLTSTYFTKCFGISEQCAKKIMDKQGYENLESAVSDLSPVKTSSIASETRLVTLFYLSTQETLTNVREKIGKIIEFDLEEAAPKNVSNIQDFIERVSSIFGSNAVKNFMELVLVSPLIIGKILNDDFKEILSACSHDRETALIFAQKFSQNADLREWLLNKGGANHVNEALSRIYEDNERKAKFFRSILDFDYKLANNPTPESPFFYRAAEQEKAISSELNMPIETHNGLLSMMSKVINVVFLRSLMKEEFELWATLVSEDTDFVGESTRDLFYRILKEAKNHCSSQKDAPDDYKKYCDSILLRTEENVSLLEKAFEEFMKLVKSGQFDQNLALLSRKKSFLRSLDKSRRKELIECFDSPGQIASLFSPRDLACFIEQRPFFFSTPDMFALLDNNDKRMLAQKCPDFFENNIEMLELLVKTFSEDKDKLDCVQRFFPEHFDPKIFSLVPEYQRLEFARLHPEYFKDNPAAFSMIPDGGLHKFEFVRLHPEYFKDNLKMFSLLRDYDRLEFAKLYPEYFKDNPATFSMIPGAFSYRLDFAKLYPEYFKDNLEMFGLLNDSSQLEFVKLHPEFLKDNLATFSIILNRTSYKLEFAKLYPEYFKDNLGMFSLLDNSDQLAFVKLHPEYFKDNLATFNIILNRTSHKFKFAKLYPEYFKDNPEMFSLLDNSDRLEFAKLHPEYFESNPTMFSLLDNSGRFEFAKLHPEFFKDNLTMFSLLDVYNNVFEFAKLHPEFFKNKAILNVLSKGKIGELCELYPELKQYCSQPGGVESRGEN